MKVTFHQPIFATCSYDPGYTLQISLILSTWYTSPLPITLTNGFAIDTIIIIIRLQSMCFYNNHCMVWNFTNLSTRIQKVAIKSHLMTSITQCSLPIWISPLNQSMCMLFSLQEYQALTNHKWTFPNNFIFSLLLLLRENPTKKLQTHKRHVHI